MLKIQCLIFTSSLLEMFQTNGSEGLSEESNILGGSHFTSNILREDWCTEQMSLSPCEEGSTKTTLLSELWEWMIGEDKATALAENVTQTSHSLSTSSTSC